MLNLNNGYLRFALLNLIAWCALFLTASVQAILPAPPQLAASSYVLMDADSGQIIVEDNANQQLPPASLTKIMTAFIVFAELENGSISKDDMVPISVKAWKMGGSRMFVREGTSVRLEDLLRGVIIQSGNDASVALAEHIAGDEATFADMMNQMAARLGMTGTHYKNATGWPAEGHVSTAHDLALLSNALVARFPEHYAMYSEREFTYNDITQSNRNGLLWRDSSVDGIKTGHTEEAGYCLVASAVKDDMRLITVVMGTNSSRAREQETQKLMSYGFRYYETSELYAANDVVMSPRVWGGADESVNLVVDTPLVVTIPRGAKDELEALVEVDSEITAPIKAGDQLGDLNIKYQGELLASRQLIAANNVEQAGLLSRLWDMLLLLVRGLLGLES